MGNRTPARISWAADILDVQPDDAILEVGCGRGHAIQPICERLTTGRITAIDRSEKMARISAESNAIYVEAGKANIIHTDLLNADLPDSSFNKIFLFNINVFWMDPAEELCAVRRLLKKAGRFYIFHQPPPGCSSAEYAEEFKKNLAANSFDVVETLHADAKDFDAACVVSRPL